MQYVLFQNLQQRAAVPVHDALGHTGRTRGIHDEQWVIEWYGFVAELRVGDAEL